MAEIELIGQGEALSDEFPFRAQWIFRGALFLYEGLNGRGPSRLARFVWRAKEAGGINIWDLAKAFGMSAHQIFEHNRLRTLHLVDAGEAITTPTGGKIKSYTFEIGGRREVLTVEVGPFGSA